jgi:hypothetical protein
LGFAVSFAVAVFLVIAHVSLLLLFAVAILFLLLLAALVVIAAFFVGNIVDKSGLVFGVLTFFVLVAAFFLVTLFVAFCVAAAARGCSRPLRPCGRLGTGF